MNRRSFLRALIAAPILSSLPWGSIASAIESALPRVAGDIRYLLREHSVSELISKTLIRNRHKVLATVTGSNQLLKRIKNVH